MSINRILMKPQSSDVGNAFIMTMGQQSSQYGYNRFNNASYGEVEGNAEHEGKAVTLVMISYSSGWLDFIFNVEGVTSGRYNVTIKITSMETNITANIEFPNIQYQSYIPGFYDYTNRLPSEVATMFNNKNVGKKFKVEIVFN